MSGRLDRVAIQGILPHRDPFLFVDEILEVVAGQKVVGLVRVADAAAFLVKDDAGKAHFPATLLTEAMAQVGAVLVLYPEENRGRTIYFRSIEDATFPERVPAGSTVRVEGSVQKMRGRLGSLRMKAFVCDDLVAEGVMSFAL